VPSWGPGVARRARSSSAYSTTDLSENTIRDYALANGRVDVKVCAVDDTWSALKHVIRVSDR
jgi:hypothetical protein